MASGIIEGGYSDGGKKWYFSWSSSYSSPGKTTVSWSLNAYEGSDSWSYGSYSLSVPGYSNSTGRFKVYAGTHASGSFTVTHDTNGNGSFWLSFSETMYTSTSYDHSRTIGVDRNYPYTACGAPTSVTVSPSIIKPGETATVKWTGASSGTSNTINGYIISFNGINYSVSSTKTYGSYTITLPESGSRGTSYTACVKTKGTAGSSYYSRATTSNSFSINRLPTAPSSTTTSDIVATTIDTHSIQFTSGIDEDSQQVVVQYSTTIDGPKTTLTDNTYTFNNITSWEEGSSQIIYLWSYDGLENSENHITYQLTRNKKPEAVFTTRPAQSPDIEEVDVYTPDSSYLYITKLIHRATATGAASRVFKYFWYYTYVEDGADVDNLISNRGTNIELGVDYTPILDKYYKIKLKVYDGYEYSDTVTYINNTVEKYILPSFPSVTINNLTNELTNAATDYNNRFYNYAQFNYNIIQTPGCREVGLNGIFFKNNNEINYINHTSQTETIVGQSGTVINNKLTETYGCLANDQIYAGYILTDSNNNTSLVKTSASGSNTMLVRTNELTWTNTPSSITPISLQLETFNGSQALLVNIGGITDGVGNTFTSSKFDIIKWSLKFNKYTGSTKNINTQFEHIKMDSYGHIPNSNNWNTIIDGQNLQLTKTSITSLYDDATNIANNSIINDSFDLIIENEFGQSLTTSFNITINYQYKPQWENTSIIGRTYSKPGNAGDPEAPYWTIDTLTNTRTSIEQRFLNINDTLSLKSPTITDRNTSIDNGYTINIEESIVDPSIVTPSLTDQAISVWNPSGGLDTYFDSSLYTIVRFTQSDLAAGSDSLVGEMSARTFKINVVQSNKTNLNTYWCLFRMNIVDPDGLTSNWTYFPYPLLKTNYIYPQLQISNVTRMINGSTPTNNLEFSNLFTKIYSSRLKYDNNSTTTYSNYTRSIAFTNEVAPVVHLQYKDDPDDPWTSLENPPFTYSYFDEETSYNYLNVGTKILQNFSPVETASRLYLKLEVLLPISEYDKFLLTSDEYILFLETPLIAYRHQKLGINVKDLDQDVLLQVQQPDSSIKIIKLSGNGNTAFVDVNTGNIMSFIIDGGNWNSQ